MVNPQSNRRPGGSFARNLVLALVYAASAQAGFMAAGANSSVTAMWPPSGIAVAAVLLAGRGMWPGIAVGALAANLLNGASFPLAAGIAVGNTLGPLVGGLILRRMGVRASLDRLRDVTLLVVGGMGAMTITATFGTAALFVTTGSTDPAAWVTWWVGDALGVVLFAPFVLTMFANDGLLRKRWAHALTLLGLLTVGTTLALITDSPIGYLVVPLAMAAAIVLEQQGAAIAALILTTIDVTFIVVSHGPQPRLDAEIMTMQGINATIGFVLFALASVMHERRRAQSSLEDAAHELEHRVTERTRELLRANELLELEVHERRATEDALRTSEERLAQAQRLAHIGSFQWDAMTDRSEWSEELFRIYGLDPSGPPPSFEDYLGFVRADVRDRVRASIQEGIGSGQSLNHEYPVVLPDGQKKWVQAYIEVVNAPDGSLAGLRGTCQDVTDRKLAEARLRWSEGRSRALLESAPDAVIVVDPTGKIVLTNKQSTRLFGYEAGELLGRSVEILVPGELRDRHGEHRRLYNAQPASRPMGAGRDLYAVRKDGSRFPVDISLSPVETDSGFLVFALVRDASERRRVEDALRTALDREREASEDLRRLDRAKDAFLSAVSHELRTPLTSILGYAELLEEPSVQSSPEMTVDLIARVRSSAHRLNDLLGDLLDLDRLHRGIVAPRRRPTDLRSLVRRAISSVDLGPRSLTLEIDDAIVKVDPAQTERIIENLLSNAIRYTPEGASIRIVATEADEGIGLVVEDDGPGVPRELWPTIFEPFVRADTGTFTQGTGIGLSLVERFARLHGGTAEVDEGPAGGARFHVSLPGPQRVVPDVGRAVA